MRALKSGCASCGARKSGTYRCSNCGAAIAVNGYSIEKLLQLTPRGRVYQARTSTRLVALKELVFATVPDVKTIERFEREALTLRQLRHPNIPAFVESFEDGRGRERRVYLAQEFVEGLNLDQKMAEHRFCEADAREIAASVLQTLDYLHSLSPPLIHRDVKPANIIARGDGRYSLVDFGAVRDGAVSAAASSSGAGTFGFMAPEQLVHRADARSDLYSLGMTLVHLLSRRPVHEVVTPELRVVVRPYVNASEPFLRFLEQLVEKSPAHRYSSAVRALSALEALSRDEAPVGARPPRETNQYMRAVSRVMPLPASRSGAARAQAIRWAHSKQPPTEEARHAFPWLLEFEDERIGLRPGCVYVLGRSDDVDIVVPDRWVKSDTVSRRHAVMGVGENGVIVQDAKSKNGTRVGTVQLGQGAVILVREPTLIGFGKLVAQLRPLSRDEARR